MRAPRSAFCFGVLALLFVPAALPAIAQPDPTREGHVLAAGPEEILVAGGGVGVVLVRIVARDPVVRLHFEHAITMTGHSLYEVVGAVSSMAHRLRADGAPEIDSGITIYEPGRGMVGVEAAGVEAGPFTYLPASEGTARFTVTRTIRANESGLLWHVFSTYPGATWDHRVRVEGHVDVTFPAPPEDALLVVGREAYAPRAPTWGNGAWVFPQPSQAVVTLDAPAYGFLFLGEWLLRVGEAPRGEGSLQTPSGETLRRNDTLGQPGLIETGTWTFHVDAGHYAILPAQFVGVRTPHTLWGSA